MGIIEKIKQGLNNIYGKNDDDMNYVIIGASASGINCAKTIRRLSEKAQITIISKDENVYSRCMLHHYISDHKSVEDINFVENNFFEKYDIKWLKGNSVNDIIIKEKAVKLSDGTKVGYDKLFIGSGASSFIPPIKNLREGKNIYSLRNIEDATKIKEEVKGKKDVLVLGAGLVGIDSAIGLLEKNASLTILEMGNQILPMQLDFESANKYEVIFRKNNIKIIKNSKMNEVVLNNKGEVASVILDDGKKIKCDMIIVSTGVRPNIEFIKNDEISIENGIVIDERCETSQIDIYAGGDVCARTPIWPMAVKQGIIAAYNMVGQNKELNDTFGLKNSINFLGLQTISLGIINSHNDEYEVSIMKDNDNYKKILHKNGIIYGAIVQGDVSYCGVLSKLISEKIDISKINKDIFDIDYSDFFDMKENGEYKYKIS